MKLIAIVLSGFAEFLDDKLDLLFGIVVIILAVGKAQDALMEARVFLDPTKEFVLGCAGILHIGKHQPGEF